jgi:hypothetical protein
MAKNDIYIPLRVDDFTIQRVLKRVERIPAPSRNFIYVRFKFTDSWVGLKKTAVFKKQGYQTINTPVEDDLAAVPNEMMSSPGIIKVSLFADDLRVVGEADIEVVAGGFELGTPPMPPGSAYANVQTTIPENAVLFIRELNGIFQFFANGKWNNVTSGEPGEGGELSLFKIAFEQSDWEPHLIFYRFFIPAILHGKGYEPMVNNIVRDGAEYRDGVSTDWRTYSNGDIALIAGNPFKGEVTII